MKGLIVIWLTLLLPVSTMALTYEAARSDANISRCQTIQDNMFKNEQKKKSLRGGKNKEARKSLDRAYNKLQDYYSDYDCKMVRNKLDNSARKFGI
jgi:hypothetical protein|tara:strand:+ start:4379 stop:4666 length:288 start_codon:yes stop_codon:yes gene_type:complete